MKILNTQCLRNSVESGERTVATLCSSPAYPATCRIQRESVSILLVIAEQNEVSIECGSVNRTKK